MIITSDFVFIHLHKSGGTFVNKILAQYYPGAKCPGYHLPYSYLTDEFRQLPTFGLVRNPWAYYVSWYYFQMGMPQQNPLFLLMSNNKQLGFEETITNLLNLGSNPEMLNNVISLFPDDFPNRGINLTKNCFSTLKDSNLGFYSFLYQRMFADCNNLTIGKVDTLRNDLLSFLKQFNSYPGAALESDVLSSEKSNCSNHKSYTEYYSKELKELVQQKDSSLINLYSYEF